jgi:hypothetical protein
MTPTNTITHLTWSGAAYDPFGAELPRGLILPGRPMCYQMAGCWDCDWTAIARTYAEICDVRDEHRDRSRIVEPLQIPLAVAA